MSRKKVRINEETFKKIVSNSIKKIISENYNISDLDELMEFLWLKPNVTNLNVDIFVDDGGSYKRNNHYLLLFARNGYDKSVSDFIPFSISNQPIILDDNIDYHITYNDIFAIQDFICANLKPLIELANSQISHSDFLNSIKIPSYSIAENKVTINEMATLRSNDSKLPMDIWLDEGGTFQGHAPRLKFRASNEQKTTREFSSMLLTNPPTIENMPDNSPLKSKDIKKLKQFVVNNLELLLQLANGQIDYITEFLPNMKV